MMTAKQPVKIKTAKAARKKPGKPRGTLSQALILRTAVEIIDSDGLGGLTVRKLSARLGVSAMAIYRHYKNKAEIERELVDLVVGDYDVTNHHEEHWEDWIFTTYAKMRQALCTHPGVMPLLDNASYQGNNALAVMDRILLELRRAGLTPHQSAQLFHMLMAHIIGTVVLMNEDSRRAIASGAEDTDAHTRLRKLSVEMVPLGKFPNIVDLAPDLTQVSEPREFKDSVMQIIKSVAGN